MAELEIKVVPVEVQVDANKKTKLIPKDQEAHRGDTIKWNLKVDPSVLGPTVHVKPLDLLLLVPDPASGWDNGKGMPFGGAVPPRATCNKAAGPPPLEYEVTVEFPVGSKAKPVIGSIIIVDP